jgi:hypothetical protein
MGEKITRYLPFYIGCDTNRGQLLGICGDLVQTKAQDGQVIELDADNEAFDLKPYLKRLSSLSEEESTELIRLGFSIGRPKGYSFAPEAFLFLLGLKVDLFGLIDEGLAIELI